MSKFNVALDNLNPSFGERLNPIQYITTKEEADQFRADYLAWLENRLRVVPEEPLKPGQTALECVNANIAYYAGYFGEAAKIRLLTLFEIGL